MFCVAVQAGRVPGDSGGSEMGCKQGRQSRRGVDHQGSDLEAGVLHTLYYYQFSQQPSAFFMVQLSHPYMTTRKP